MNTPDATTRPDQTGTANPGSLNPVCSATATETAEQWRVRTKHHWAKHNAAMDNFMRLRRVYRGKKMRRLKKWMREVERTLYAIPTPPETEAA